MIFSNGIKGINKQLTRLEELLEHISNPSEYGTRGIQQDIKEVEDILGSLNGKFGGLSNKVYSKDKVMDVCKRWDRDVEKYNSAKTNYSQYLRAIGDRTDIESEYFQESNKSADGVATASKNLQMHYSPKVSRVRVAAASLAIAFGLGFGSLALKNGVENSKISQAYNEVQTENQMLNDKYQTILAEREILQDKLANAKTKEEYDAIKSQLDAKDAEIAGLVTDLDIANVEKNLYKTLWEASTKDYDTLLGKYNVLAKTNEQLEKDLETAVKKSNQLGIDLSELEAKYGDLFTKYNQLESDYKTALANAEELSETIKTLTAENNALKLENERLQNLIDSGKVDDSTIAEYLETIRKNEARIDELEGLLETSASELEKANKEIARLNGELNKANTEKQSLVDQINKLTQENASLKGDNESKDTTIAELKEQLKSETTGSLRNSCIKIIIDEVGISANDAYKLTDDQIAEYMYYLVGGKVSDSPYGPGTGSIDSNEKENSTGSGSSESKGDSAYEGNSGTPNVKEDDNTIGGGSSENNGNSDYNGNSGTPGVKEDDNTIGNDDEYENGEGSPFGPNSGNPTGKEDGSGTGKDDKNNGDIFTKE